jgi:EAL domain-containing protein (putative c-di-GMP-specific phosphodiesterase class I)
LRRHELDPSRLVLEITETAVVTDIDKATRALDRLRDAGLRISLDDFGQGQTSLGFLARLPVSELKIDRAFVTPMSTDVANAAIVRSVIELAHNLGMAVVAEGAEDASTVDALRVVECDTVQGFTIAGPMPAADVAGWVRSSATMQTR